MAIAVLAQSTETKMVQKAERTKRASETQTKIKIKLSDKQISTHLIHSSRHKK
jgi:hypothetical protein